MQSFVCSVFEIGMKMFVQLHSKLETAKVFAIMLNDLSEENRKFRYFASKLIVSSEMIYVVAQKKGQTKLFYRNRVVLFS